MQTFIQEAKYQAETISIITSFADVLPAGDSIIGTPEITIVVVSGIDINPSAILYEGVSIITGNTVEQRIRLGVIGVIYLIHFTIQTLLRNTFEKECYLAILPIDATNTPISYINTQTTQLYPIEPTAEEYKALVQFISGKFLPVPLDLEEYKALLSFSGGTLVSIVLPYIAPPESYQAAIFINSGTLISIVIPYSCPAENYKAAMSFLSGALTTVVIPYNYSYESYQASISFVSGTLV